MELVVIPMKDVQRYVEELFDRTEEAEETARILKGVLEARSSRLSEIARSIPGMRKPTTK